MKFDIRLCQFALKNKLSFEYFVWNYLKTLNNSGFHDISELDALNFRANLLKTKLKSNLFFIVDGKKIVLKSKKNFINYCSKKKSHISIQDLNKFPRRLSVSDKQLIKGWDSTSVKYFLICLVGCQYDESKPYALSLISSDTNCSISTIQRALSNIFVSKIVKIQNAESPRSYYQNKKLVNLSPNYNMFTLKIVD